ncbi:hypothetical protein GCM10011515_21670 [Tsuneonella deserti]|uniref:L,D-TPase catalytic domain-containing protein n=1 Tax=Tsuneonella deserti TaxID=2035528 RepID=A0ABQ1SD66_9SPHN|nr:L,D-transpeptidase family protein [Tsuneonella deserti]GGE01606.1 hypothetical protein GCM10011515_21670 [Tsuneonella deserti]
MNIAGATKRLPALAVIFPVLAALLGTPALAGGRGDDGERWDTATASSLLSYIEDAGNQGLRPADYEADALRAALQSQDPQRLDDQAAESFRILASDLAGGHVRPGSRGRYFIPANTLDPPRVEQLAREAMRTGQVGTVLDSLAPQDPAYAALKQELRRGPSNKQTRGHLLATLERWRWLPRDMGQRYLVVNIPEYRLRLYEGGREVASHRVIVGKPSTPTAQFHADVTGVILNPSWYVPSSIIRESVGSLVRNRPAEARRRGYTWTYAGGLRVTQGPGPGNSLGQMRLDMPNPLSMFIHDTPSKELFAREDRALSHGCMRTDKPFDLAQILLGKVGWDRAWIDAVVASRQTTRVALDMPVPVYVVYMTAIPQPDGTIAYAKDPYKLDGSLASQFD